MPSASASTAVVRNPRSLSNVLAPNFASWNSQCMFYIRTTARKGPGKLLVVGCLMEMLRLLQHLSPFAGLTELDQHLAKEIMSRIVFGIHLNRTAQYSLGIFVFLL